MKHFLSTNTKASSAVVDGKSIEFVPAVYMPGTATEWGTYSTENAKEIEALAKVPYVSEISEEDANAYEIQRRNRADYSTIVRFNAGGISTDPKGSIAAVVVDSPADPGRVAPIETPDEILATKVASKKGR